MPINILMPALSPTMEKGNLAKWLKKEGDAVKTGDMIAEIETDKATMEYEAVDDGVIAKIVVPEGTTDVPVNQPIAVLAAEGEDVKRRLARGRQRGRGASRSVGRPARGSPHPAPSAPPSPKPGRDGGASGASPSYVAGTNAEAGTDPTPASGRVASATSRVGSNGHAGSNGQPVACLPRRWRAASPRTPASISVKSPAAARMAASSPAMWRRQRRAALATCARWPGPAPATAAPVIAPAPAMSDQRRATVQARQLRSGAARQHATNHRAAADTAKQTIPHFYLTVDCDIGKLLDAREEINAAAAKGEDGKPA